MLKTTAITKNYGNTKVLKGIDMSIQKGEIVSIVGASGAGKSTLLHIIGSLDKPTSGTVEIEGQDISLLDEKKLANFRNQKIGFIFQFHNLLPEFTVIENILMPAFIAQNKKPKEDKAIQLLDLLGLTDKKNNFPSQLSGGEQQRVAVARALINSPAIVFADEPSGNLDTANAQELHKLFFTLRDTFKQTFVIITHNQELATMADKQLLMEDGVLKQKE